MKKDLIFLFLLLALCVSAQNPVADRVVYPGARGGGKYATGGRGGHVIFVTSLEDDEAMPGTLRWAIAQKGRRIILFRVAGIIDLKSPLMIKGPNLTIAGQSAPGDGICLKGYPVSVNTNNVILQFLRFRMGDENQAQDDALHGARKQDLLIDHCSMSWSTDECSSFYDNTDFTMQWCIISESLRNSVHKKGSHGYGGIWGGTNATFHHNLLAHHDSRNPRFCGARYNNSPENEKVDMINNVIYNWGSNSGYAGEGGYYNIIGNYYKPGPATLAKKGQSEYRIFSPNSDEGANAQAKGVWGKFFVSGNIMSGNEEVTGNNRIGFHVNNREGESMTADSLLSEHVFPFITMEPQAAAEAYREVLLKSGASMARDSIDMRIVGEVERGSFTYTGSRGSRNGLIDSQQDVGGWPLYKTDVSEIPVDSDHDGIPDHWEDAHGLNSKDASDALQIKSCGVTNLEVYLYSLVQHLY